MQRRQYTNNVRNDQKSSTFQILEWIHRIKPEPKKYHNKTASKKVFTLIQNLNKKRCTSKQSKIRHYNTVIKTQILYANETLSIYKKYRNWKKSRKKNIIKKILSARLTPDGYRLHSMQMVDFLLLFKNQS